MEKQDPKGKHRETSATEERRFNREDSGRTERFSTPFAKDKRKRITRVEKTVPQRRNDEEAPREKPFRREELPRKPYSGSNERRSYNPNFTKDNKLKTPGRPSYGKSGDPYNSDRHDGRKSYGEKPKRPSYNTGEPDPFNREDGPHRTYKNSGPRTGGSKPDFKKGKPKISGNGRRTDGTYPTFPAPQIEDEIRLNRYIAASGMSSRREADEVIRAGRVTVNGEVITEMGAKVKAGDIVQVDGETVRSEKKVYILMNKPKGFVTTLEDPFADKTVMDLLKNACKERVYPVGRLDKNSLGVLLITNDGDLTKRLTHPSYNKKKIYQVALNKPLTKADMESIIEGITLDDGEIHADAIDYVNANKKEVGIEIHSGRNRIVRRIFEHFGYKVNKLDRVYFAGLTKKNLKRGQWRFLSPKEVEILRSGMYE